MRWAGHAAYMGEMEIYTRFLLGNLKGGAHLEDPGVERKIILEWILGK